MDDPITRLHQDFEQLKTDCLTTPYPEVNDRINRIQAIKQSLITNKHALINALSEDYGYRSEFDTLLADILATVNHANYTLKHIRGWTKPQRRSAGLMLFPSRVEVLPQPLGVVGIITPWNFPVNLSLNPTITALAAGNRVMLKMSEFTPATNKVVREVLKPVSDQVVLVEGEVEVAKAFSSLTFDHLFFTGSTSVGKQVAMAAAKNLVPVTLELGGKSPVIIDDRIDMRRAIDAILLGKSVNSGQICVAPDYILLPPGRIQEFIDTYQKRFDRYYAHNKQNNRLSCIINQQQYQRLQDHLEDARQKGGRLHHINAAQPFGGHFLPPTLISNVNDEMSVMQHEVFGSLLPLVSYQTVEQAIGFVRARHHPLALYIMSDDKELVDMIVRQTHSGGVAVNDTLLQVAAEGAPFGGIGHSGIGCYHGKEGFDTFSHAKTVLHTGSWLPRSRFLLRYRDLSARLLDKLFIR